MQIGDFGIACMSNGGSTRVEDVGTLLYQSPEILNDNNAKQISDGYDSRTDIWSFGCILIRLCNFDTPFMAMAENRLI